MPIKIAIIIAIIVFLLCLNLAFYLDNKEYHLIKKLKNKWHNWLYTSYPLLHNICYAKIQGATGNEKAIETQNVISSHNNFFLIGLNEKNEWVKIDNNDFFIYFESSKTFNKVDTTLKEIYKKNKAVVIDDFRYRIVNCNVKEDKDLKNYHLYQFHYENNIIGASINGGSIPTKWLQIKEFYERNWFAFWTLLLTFLSSILNLIFKLVYRI